MADRDKESLASWRRRWRPPDTGSAPRPARRAALRVLGHEVEEVARVGEEATARHRSVIDAIASGDVLAGRQHAVARVAAGARRRPRSAGGAAEGILCLTSIDTALAAAATLEPRVFRQIDDVRPLQDWLGADAVPV